MKILLVNPNQYRTPPVPPLALEHLAGALIDSPHEYKIVDLCFSDDPASVIDAAIKDFNPHIAGFTIRNIDTCIYQNNVFFLDSIKDIVTHVKQSGIPVILGGAGFSFIPEGILDYLGADWGIKGPGENALRHFLDMSESTFPPTGTVFEGWHFGINPDLKVKRGESIDYEKYVSNRSILGFATHFGCAERCSYCHEQSSQVMFRNPECVVDEISACADRGFDTFHLCDTEFNQNLGHCKQFLETLIRKGPKINWALYLKSSPYDSELFGLLKKSGADMITLSLPTCADWIENAHGLCSTAKDNGLKIAVDLLLGFPGESIDDARSMIDSLRGLSADTIGLNSTIRLMPGLRVTDEIMETADYRKYLLGETENNPHLIRPVFYQHLSADMLREIVGDDPLFRIEGFERTSNYERI
ncbi:B12-binding domain-containing radical SAM protein [Candidatus Latescibacterota bacterium]